MLSTALPQIPIFCSLSSQWGSQVSHASFTDGNQWVPHRGQPHSTLLPVTILHQHWQHQQPSAIYTGQHEAVKAHLVCPTEYLLQLIPLLS